MSSSESASEPSESEDSSFTIRVNDEARKKKRSAKAAATKFRCNHCPATFKSRVPAHKHSFVCEQRLKNLTCGWCNTVFKTRCTLAKHALMHGDSSYKAVLAIEKKSKPHSIHICEVCQKSFHHKYKLKYHIRKMHFNLKAKRPYAELKKVNQVWFEKVLNSNNIMEIRKTGQNTLVMRKLDENTAIKVKDVDTEIIDVSELYPTDQGKVKVKCEVCKGMYSKGDLPKHMQEVHMNIRKHHCNNCNRSFKRSYLYLQHVCKRQTKVRGIRNADKTIRITSIESLSMPWCDS